MTELEQISEELKTRGVLSVFFHVCIRHCQSYTRRSTCRAREFLRAYLDGRSTKMDAIGDTPNLDDSIDPESVGLPPYPLGEVVGPCVCGSWPGGECFRCRIIQVDQTLPAWYNRIIDLVGNEKGK